MTFEQNMEVSKPQCPNTGTPEAMTNCLRCISVLELELIGFLHMRRTRVDKVNAELVTLTYGTIVAQLCQDYDSNYQDVNKQLDKMGYNIGMRLIEDFLAKSGVGRCANFRETADMIAKVGVTPGHGEWR